MIVCYAAVVTVAVFTGGDFESLVRERPGASAGVAIADARDAKRPAAASAPSEPEQANALLPARILSQLADRTGLTGDAAGPLARAVEHVAPLPIAELREAAQTHAASRLGALQAVEGPRRVELSTYGDLMRFPQASRGRPVSLVGVIRSSESMTLDGTEALLVRCAPVENPTGMAAVLLPAVKAAPPVGTRISLTGVFAKLVELPTDDEQEAEVAPLFIAPSLSAQSSNADASPDRSHWSDVRHRTLGVRDVEKRLYYQVLKLAADADVPVLQAAARGQVAERRREAPALRKREPFPVFVDLFKNPSAYEGKAVTLKGYAREIRKYPAGTNAEGLETLYEAWVYTDDSQSNPAVIVASSASPDLPIGDDVQVPIEATGYFFKIYGYRAHDTTRVAPMILAGRIERLPEPVPAGPPGWLLATLAALFSALFGWLLMSYLGTRKRRVWQTGDAPPDFSVVQGKDQPER
ncbi:MAG: hypothetical protein M3552_23140 [Planctomycetota bacterium]|nr:hypothetical protein [Planctomycetota bacterium]